jgi:hypothetical protein
MGFIKMTVKSDMVLIVLAIVAFGFIVKDYLFGGQKKFIMSSQSLEKRTRKL